MASKIYWYHNDANNTISQREFTSMEIKIDLITTTMTKLTITTMTKLTITIADQEQWGHSKRNYLSNFSSNIYNNC